MIEILLVEDDEGDIFLIKEQVKKASFDSNIHIAHNGEDALRFLNAPQSPRIDFIISDINMPRMNGHEFLTEVAQNAELKKTPIAILTHSENLNDYIEAFQLNAVACIDKPLNQQKITLIIKSVEAFWAKG